ncbi:hypothetical protein Ocin01_09193 [Orchesella cincta]|uniref:Gustatory receptor n=1 Tax=Orchesella cincta TaxID=48709 RepID=A0A1D2MX03_ORCCI|nr:hypothetical protein Ocin01_09193 [Orchesella cincta]
MGAFYWSQSLGVGSGTLLYLNIFNFHSIFNSNSGRKETFCSTKSGMQINPYKTEDFETPLPATPTPYHSDNIKTTPKHFLRFFLDIGFYLCVFPYKIADTGYGAYQKRQWIPQQIMCAALHFGAYLDTLTNIRAINYGDIATRPKLYFEIFTTILHSLTCLAFACCAWRSAEKLCELVRNVQKCPIISLWFPKHVNFTVSALTLLYVVLAILNPIFKDGGNQDTWQGWYDYHARRGRFITFFGNFSNDFSSLNAENSKVFTGFHINTHDLPFAILSYVVNGAEWISIYYVDLMMLVMSLTLWCSSIYFIKTLKKENCKTAFLHYEALKGLSALINSTIGKVTLVYTIDSILYYSTQLEVLFVPGRWFHKLVVVQFFVASLCWLHFASNACLQMDRFREWIRCKENRFSLPSKSVSVMLLLDEISSNPVGLSGNGLFVINYKFVSQVKFDYCLRKLSAFTSSIFAIYLEGKKILPEDNFEYLNSALKFY